MHKIKQLFKKNQTDKNKLFKWEIFKKAIAIKSLKGVKLVIKYDTHHDLAFKKYDDLIMKAIHASSSGNKKTFQIVEHLILHSFKTNAYHKMNKLFYVYKHASDNLPLLKFLMKGKTVKVLSVDEKAELYNVVFSRIPYNHYFSLYNKKEEIFKGLAQIT